MGVRDEDLLCKMMYACGRNNPLSQNLPVLPAPPKGELFQIGETRKKREAKRLAFFRFDLSFGVERGEQPLSRGASASKSLALFWFSFGAKREHLPSAMPFAKGLKHNPRDRSLAGSITPALLPLRPRPPR